MLLQTVLPLTGLPIMFTGSIAALMSSLFHGRTVVFIEFYYLSQSMYINHEELLYILKKGELIEVLLKACIQKSNLRLLLKCDGVVHSS